MNSSENAKLIKAIVLDVDGVMTDGRLGYTGRDVIKFFDIKDGHAVKLAMRAGLKVGILSGRSDDANQQRADELALNFRYQGEKDKNAAFTRLLDEQGLRAEECLYIGDDLVDIPVIRRAGIGVCVSNAHDEVKKYADWETELCGGRGAVCEVIVRLLKERDDWQSIMERYLIT